MKQYQNYIFDLYGTLIDIHTDEESFRFWHELKDQCRLIEQPAVLRKCYYELCEEETRKHPQANAEIDLYPVFAQLFHTHDEMQIHRLAYHFRRLSRHRFEVYDGVIDVLSKLKEEGKGIYLLSNAQVLFTLPELKETGLEQYFDGICISSAVGFRKPELPLLENLMKKYKMAKQECVFFGNDFEDDMAMAHKAGLDAVYINTAGWPDDVIAERQKEYGFMLSAGSVKEALERESV